jgi:OmpA-OmpF porin, OOP family
MRMQLRTGIGVAACGLLLLGTGCATKRHVKAAIAPVEQRVGEVEKRAGQNEADIDAVEKQTSAAAEAAAGADKEAKLAQGMARTADGKAVKAGERADGAYTLADKTNVRLSETEQRMDRMFENLDNYQLLKSESVLFGFNKSELTPEMKQQLDTLAAELQSQKRYVIEVQGFTDQTGGAAYNQELSRKRAAAVVRYLTLTHNVPLRRIQMLGVGAEGAIADNKTRTGRTQNRRVEVKVFALPDGKADTAATVAKSL